MSSCIVCESPKRGLLFRTWDRHYGIQGEYNLGKCQDCGLLFLDPMLSESELARLYPDDYYSYQAAPARNSSLREIGKRLFRLPIPTHDPEFTSPGSVLDIGCGSGEYLLKMRDRGWQVFGVEPGKRAVETGRARGLDLFHGTLLEAGFDAASFDYVRANHSFEHMPNPHEVLDEIHRILKPGGKLFIGVPNTASLEFRLFKQYWWHLCAPVHVYGYSLRTLDAIVSRHGFGRSATYFSSNYSSILGSLQIFLNRHSRTPADGGPMLKNALLIPPCHVLARFCDLLKIGDTIEVIFDRL
jgi:SAM-dependent methyltransferase